MSEQNTPPQRHGCWYEWQRSPGSTHYTIWYTLREDFTTQGYLSVYTSLNVCCVSFWIFLLVAEGLFLSTFHIAMTAVNEVENESCVLHESLSPGINQLLQIGQLVQNAKVDWLWHIKCWLLTDSPPSPRHKHAWAWECTFVYHLIDLYFYDVMISS